MHVFFINLNGKTVAFEGPTAMTVAEGVAMEARLTGEAPGKYGAGAVVDARNRGPGSCAFVFQDPKSLLYTMGSGTNLADAMRSKKSHVNNGKALIHHEIVCPPGS